MDLDIQKFHDQLIQFLIRVHSFLVKWKFKKPDSDAQMIKVIKA